jgi:DNA-binding NarL/FixJ family response regulator
MSQAAAQLINLFLLDDHAMFREGLARMLEKAGPEGDRTKLVVRGRWPSFRQAARA